MNGNNMVKKWISQKLSGKKNFTWQNVRGPTRMLQVSYGNIQSSVTESEQKCSVLSSLGDSAPHFHTQTVTDTLINNEKM